MIKNFNFYDVYGYFLPGFVLLAVLWLPFGIFEGHWPQAEFSSALVAVIAGYIVGHILQAIAQNTIPSTIKDIRGKRRLPSDILLDANLLSLPLGNRQQLSALILSRFELDVNINLNRATATAEELKQVSSIRNDALLLCRATLIHNKVASYAEQFEGLYALMRGLAAAFGLGIVYHLGWATSRLLSPGWEETVGIAISAMLLIAIVAAIFLTDLIQSLRVGLNVRQRSKSENILITAVIIIVVLALFGEFRLGADSQKWSWVAVAMGLTIAVLTRFIPDSPKSEGLNIWVARLLAWLKSAPIIFALLALGYSLGAADVKSFDDRGKLVLIILTGLFVSLRCLTSYQFFALEFPKAIYRDFYNYEKLKDEAATRDAQRGC